MHTNKILKQLFSLFEQLRENCWNSLNGRGFRFYDIWIVTNQAENICVKICHYSQTPVLFKHWHNLTVTQQRLKFERRKDIEWRCLRAEAVYGAFGAKRNIRQQVRERVCCWVLGKMSKWWQINWCFLYRHPCCCYLHCFFCVCACENACFFVFRSLNTSVWTCTLLFNWTFCFLSSASSLRGISQPLS